MRAFILAVALLSAGAAQAQTVMRDPEVTAAVEAKLRSDPTLAEAPIAVTSRAGVVHMTGEVPGTFAFDRAADVAREVPGVVAVDNDLRVRPRKGGPEYGTAGK